MFNKTLGLVLFFVGIYLLFTAKTTQDSIIGWLVWANSDIFFLRASVQDLRKDL